MGAGRTPEGTEAGFALVGALLALGLLSLLAAAGLLLSAAEARVSGSHRASAEAFLRAQAALSRFAAEAVGDPPGELALSVPGGEATVEAERLLRLPDGRILYRVRARSSDDAGSAVREVERLLVSAPAFGTAPAALVSTVALEGGGAGALVSGRDVAAADGCPAPPGDVAGVSVPPGGAADLTAGAVEGSPAVRETTAPAAPGVEDGPALIARLVALAGAPVTVVPGGAALGADDAGTGLLVSEGDLLLGAGFRWEGVVASGGTLAARDDAAVRGAVLAGLAATPDSVPSGPASDLGDGPLEIVYDRCAVASAARSAARLAAVPGSWREAF